MFLREQALDTHTSYLLLVQQAALSPQRAINIKNSRMFQLLANIRLFFMFIAVYIFRVAHCATALHTDKAVESLLS